MDSTSTINNEYLVSVVIPNYNYARYLDQRLLSILNQTYRGYEIIFLDDASTDNSVSLVREQYGARLEHIEVNTVNTGNPFIQWNRGVRLSRGKYVWIAEADDYCASDFLEQLLSVMEKNPSVGLAYCHTLPVDTNSTVLDDNGFLSYLSDLHTSRWTGDFHNQGSEEIRKYLSKKNTITNVSGVLFRRDAYIAAGYAPEDMRMCGDWMMYCRVLKHADIAYVSKPLNFHRQHSAKQTNNSVLNLTYFREFLQVQEYLIGEYELADQDRRSAFHRFLDEWGRLTISSYGRIDLKGTFALARMTARVYSSLSDRLIITLNFFVNSMKSIVYKLYQWIKN